MTKKIVKRTDANNETLYFYTHSDAVDVGEGNATTSLTAALNNKASTSDVQTLSNDTLRKSPQSLSSQEKSQVHNNIGTESFVDDRAVRYDDAQVLGSEEKTQALTNLGLNGVDAEPTKNSQKMVRSGGVAEAIDNVQYARFDGIQETSVTLNTSTTATADGTVLFYVPNNVFIYKVGSTYYTLWNNTNRLTNGFYNDSESTSHALTTKIFINTIDGLPYSFDGTNFTTFAIDDEPTPNSNNLVKSGGVYPQIKAPQLDLDMYDVSRNFVLVNYPANADGSTSTSGWYKGYEVNLLPYVGKVGYIFFRGASFNPVARGIIIANDDSVESIANGGIKTNGWQCLPITANSKILRASYCTSTSGGEVWNPEFVYFSNTPFFTKERLDEISTLSLNLEEDVKRLDGHLNVEFDFSTGSTAAYASRYVEFDFALGKKYRIEVETSDSTISTYFSLRDNSGNIVNNQTGILTGSGKRYVDYVCTANAARLYMTYSTSGPAIVYDVVVSNLTDNSVAKAESEISDLDKRVVVLENERQLLLTYTSPASGSYKGTWVPCAIKAGEERLVRIVTTSTDEYYIDLYKSGSLVGHIAQHVKGTGNYPFTAIGDGDEIRFVIYSVSAAKDYIIGISNFVGYIAADAQNKANALTIEGEDNRRKGYTTYDYKYTSPASGSYKGFEIARDFKVGDIIRLTVNTSSTDVYYMQLIHNGNPVQYITNQTSGSGVYSIVAGYEAEAIRFRIVNISGANDYSFVFDSTGTAEAFRAGNIVDNIADNYSVPVPDYVSQEKERILGILREKSKNELLVVGFNTDQHMTKSVNPDTNYYPVVRGLNAIRSLAETFPFDLIVLGGDEASYVSETVEAVFADVNEVIRNTDTFACPVVAIAGNHDAVQNLPSGAADGRQEFNTKIKRNIVRKEIGGYGLRSTNAYFDDIIHKVRFVFLDDWSKNQTDIVVVLTEALSDSKLLNSDWSVVTFSHSVWRAGLATNNLSPIETNIIEIGTLFDTFVNNGGKILACINGHCHKDVQDISDGIPFIGTTCSGEVLTEISFDGIRYTKVKDTPNETAFDVFVFDFTDDKLYAIRYGAGMDRTFNLASGSVGLMLVGVSGTVTGASVDDVVKITHNNTVYSHTLTSDMTYSFSYVCPGLGDWNIVVESNGVEIYRDTISPALTDTTITKNIVIN